MTNHVQPDLFGEFDERAARAEQWRQPATCPSCGTRESSGHQLRNNHGYGINGDGIGGYPVKQHPIYGAQCVAQSLVSSHIVYATREGDADMLTRSMERGRELGLDVESIAQEAAETPATH